MLILFRKYLTECLKTRRRLNWTQEGIATALMRLSKLLHTLGEHDEAEIHAKEAYSIRDEMLSKHSEYLRDDGGDEMVVFDRMIPIWAGRFTGGLSKPT